MVRGNSKFVYKIAIKEMDFEPMHDVGN